MHILMTFLGLLVVSFTAFADSKRLVSKKITFEDSGRTFSGLEISRQGQHELNLLANEMAIHLDDLKLIASDECLEAAGGKAGYVYRKNFLIISQTAIGSEQLYSSLLHEIVHAVLWVSLRRGSPFTFNGLAFNRTEDVQHRAYGSRFGIDEIAATFFSVDYYMKIMQQQLERSKTDRSLTRFTRVTEAMYDIRNYLGRLQTMLTTLQQGIEGGTIKAGIPTPEQLSFIPKNIEWQEIETSQIKLYFPIAISKKQLEDIAKVAQNILKIIEIADDIPAKLQVLTAPPDKLILEESTKFLSLSEKIRNLFEVAFPSEYSIIKRMPAPGEKLSKINLSNVSAKSCVMVAK